MTEQEQYFNDKIFNIRRAILKFDDNLQVLIELEKIIADTKEAIEKDFNLIRPTLVLKKSQALKILDVIKQAEIK